MVFADQAVSALLFVLSLSIIHQSAVCGHGWERLAIILMRLGLAVLAFAVAFNTIFTVVPVSSLGGVIWKSSYNLVLVGVIILLKVRYNKI